MRRNIWIAIILLALTPTILIGSIAGSSMYHVMEKVQEDTLLDVTAIVSQSIQIEFDEILSEARGVAQKEPFYQVLTIKDKNSTEYHCWEKRAGHLLDNNNGRVELSAIIDLAGNVIYSNDPSLLGLKMDKTELFRNIVIKHSNSKNPTTDECKNSYYRNPITDEYNRNKLEIAVPVVGRDGELVGILRQIVSLDRIEKYIKSVRVGDTGFVYLVRKDGSVVYDDERIGNEIIYSEFEITDTLNRLLVGMENGDLKEKAGIIQSQYKGKDIVGAYRVLPDAKWIIISTINRNEAYSQIEKIKSIIFAASFLIGTIVSIVGILFVCSYNAPFNEINSSIRKIASGDMTLRCTYNGRKKDLQQLSENINQIADNFQRSESELRLASRRDQLTQLPTRYTIYEVLDTLLYKNEEQAILTLSLDDFNEINNNYGFELGDKLLCEIADMLRMLPQHICYPSRLMGDEFLVFIDNWDEESTPERIAERIIRNINSIQFVDDCKVSISASIGIEYLTEEKLDRTKLIKHSIIAMDKAKFLGKNTYVVYSRMNNKK